MMNKKTRSERLHAALWKVEGVAYVLRLLAAERVEESNALANQADVLDDAFMEIMALAEEIAEEEAGPAMRSTGTVGRRVAAFNDFMMAAYGTDADGLADIAGISREDMAEYMATEDPDELNMSVLAELGNMAGIRFSWLLDDGAAEGAEL